MSDPDDLPGDDATLCAEYVLGLLPPEEVPGFEARLAHDPALMAEVAYWSETFADLTDAVPPEPPAPALRHRIEAAAFGPPRPPLWRLVLPYLLGALAAAGLAYVASTLGWLANP